MVNKENTNELVSILCAKVKELKEESRKIDARLQKIEIALKLSPARKISRYKPTKAEIEVCKMLDVPLDAFVDNVTKRLGAERRGPGRPKGSFDTRPRRPRKTTKAINKSMPLTKRTGTSK